MAFESLNDSVECTILAEYADIHVSDLVNKNLFTGGIKIMVKRLIPLLWFVLVISLTLTNVSAQRYTPNVEPMDCAMWALPEGVSAECGRLVVPEDRSQPEGNQVHIPYAIIESPNPDLAAEPLLFYSSNGFSGDPVLGGLAGQAIDDFYGQLDRTLILTSQRGLAGGEPNFYCQEIVDAEFAHLEENVSDEERFLRNMEAIDNCIQQLTAQGVNLLTYRTSTFAADVEDLRIALGYDHWNLYGSSYGAIVVQTYVKNYEDHVVSVILDSPVSTLDKNPTTDPRAGESSLNYLLERCAQNEACHEAYPDLEQLIYETMDELRENPVAIESVDLATGAPVAVLMDDYVLSWMVAHMLTIRGDDFVPYVFYQLHEGNYDAAFTYFSPTISAFLAQAYTPALGVTVVCNDYVLPMTPEEIASADARIDEFVFAPLYRVHPFLFGSGYLYEYCQRWLPDWQPATAEEIAPVVSDVPALVYVGWADSILLVDDMRAVADRFSNSFLVEFPFSGHELQLQSECADTIGNAFLEDPMTPPDTSCIEQSLNFVLPE